MRSIQLSAKDRGDPGLNNAPDALRIPDVVLHIMAHVDAPTLLSLRLVNSLINSIIATYQRTICKSIFWRDFSIELDCCPPALRDSSKYYYLRTIVRARKAHAVALEAIAKNHFFSDFKEGRIPRDPGYYCLVAHCMRGILVIWTLNNIQEQVGPFHRLPTYIPTPTDRSVSPRPHRHPRIFYSFISAHPAAIIPKIEDSITVSEKHDLSIGTFAPRTTIEAEKRLSKVRIAQYQYLRTLDKISRIDFELAQEDLMSLMPRYIMLCCSRSIGPTTESMVLRRRFFALQQVPRFMLSVVSTDWEERSWAWDVVRMASSGPGLLPEMINNTVVPFSFEEQGELEHERVEIIQEACRLRSAAVRGTVESKGGYTLSPDVRNTAIEYWTQLSARCSTWPGHRLINL